MKSAEQKARDLLSSLGLRDAQSMTAGDLVEIANYIADAEAWRESYGYRPCPSCQQFKDGDGRLCAYCAREARIQLEEDNKL